MAKVTEMKDEIRQAAMKLVDELIAQATPFETRADNPISFSSVTIRIFAVDNANMKDIRNNIVAAGTIGEAPIDQERILNSLGLSANVGEQLKATRA